MTLRTTSGRLRLLALGVAPYVLALLVHLTVFLAARDRLPDPMASRFDASGRPVSYLSVPVAVLTGIGMFTLLGAVFAFVALNVARGRSRPGGLRGLLAVGWGLAAFLGYLLPVSTAVQRSVADAADARFPLWHLAVALGVALAAAAVGFLLALALPDSPAQDGPTTTTGRIDLADGEVASWSHRLGSGPAVLSATAAVVAGAVCGAVGYWPAAVPLLLVGALMLLFVSAYVVVDRRGLTIAPAVLHRPALHIPLGGMSTADLRDIDPVADYGGWGYRIRHNRTGLIVRSGEAIVVRRTNGREFAVTVDDSATGAALLATLIERRGTHGPRESR
ncbi:DUF1648 domain-containing protein [Streptomyces sp. NPDC004111]|uniref:DUF1648 domain-containing protein n=1 Tax=Streptomyces sp. NPDC004111 TaxID=3364690 RepID=UPI0036B6FB90